MFLLALALALALPFPFHLLLYYYPAPRVIEPIDRFDQTTRQTHHPFLHGVSSSILFGELEQDQSQEEFSLTPTPLFEEEDSGETCLTNCWVF